MYIRGYAMQTDQIISSSKHCLHLCNNSNLEEVAFSYIIDDVDAFVTNNISIWKKRFDENKIKCPIRTPERVTQDLRIVVDGSSLGNDFEKFEKKWKKQKKTICIYNTDEIKPLILKDLVDLHDRMLLSINKMRIISDKNLEKEINDIKPEIIERVVKNELRNIVLCLLLLAPMSGIDLVRAVYSKFKVFISPGMLYPTLHELNKNGLLKYEFKLKNKVYSVREKEQTKALLEKHAKANSLISEFLVG